MTEKPTLSDKRIDVPTLNEEHAYYYPERNVKQFIRDLKEEVKGLNPKDEEDWQLMMLIRIDKLAGPKLTDANNQEEKEAK